MLAQGIGAVLLSVGQKLPHYRMSVFLLPQSSSAILS